MPAAAESVNVVNVVNMVPGWNSRRAHTCDPAAVVHALADHGVRLTVEGAQIRAFGPLSDADRVLIREHKPALLAHLTAAEPPPATPAPEPVTVDDLLDRFGPLLVAGTVRTLDVLAEADPDDLPELRDRAALEGFAVALVADRRIRPLPDQALPPLARLAAELGDEPAELTEYLNRTGPGRALRVRIEREAGACDRCLLALRDDPAGGLLPVLARALDGAARSRT